MFHRSSLRAWSLLAAITVTHLTYSATITWTNGSGTGLWSDAGNWSSGGAPGAADIALFDGTATANCQVDQNISVRGILINMSYTGAVSQQPGVVMTMGSAGFVQHGGTFLGGTSSFILNGGNFTLTNGTYSASSGLMRIGGTRTTSATLFQHAGGTFNPNNGAVVLDPYCNVGAVLTWTVDVLPVTAFHDVEIKSTHGWSRPQVATAAGDTMLALHDLRHTDGYITGQFAVGNDLVIGAGADGGTGRIRVDGTGAQQYQVAAGSARTCQVLVRKPSGAFVPAAGTVDLRVQAFALEAGDFTAPSGELRTGGTWSMSQALLVHAGGTFNPNNGAVVLDPYCNVGAVLTWTVDVLPVTAFHDVEIKSTHGWSRPQVATAAGDTMLALHDLRHTDGYITGQFAVGNDLVIGAGADGGTGRIRVDGTGAQQYQVAAGSARTCRVLVRKPSGAFVPAAGTVDLRVQAFALEAGDFTAPSGELCTGGTWSTSQALLVHTGGTFNPNNGAVVLDPYCNVGAVLTWTVDVLPVTAFHDVEIKSTHGWSRPQVATAAGDTMLALHDLRHTDGYITGQFAVRNDLVIGAGADGGTGRIRVDGTGAQQYQVAAGSARTCQVLVRKPSGAFVPAAGTVDLRVQAFALEAGDFTAPSGELRTGGTWSTSQALLVHADGTFNPNNGAVVLDPYCNVGAVLTWTVDVLPVTAFHDVEIKSTHGWSRPQVATAAGDTMLALHDLRHTDGYITGQFAVRNDLVIGAGADGGTGRIRVDGTGAQQYQVAAGSARTCRVLVRKPSGAFVPAAGTVDLRVQAFALEAGDFTAPSGELCMGGTWSTSQALLVHTGGTFNPNNGAVVLDPYCNVGAVLTWTVDVLPVTAFHDVEIKSTHGWSRPQVATAAGDTMLALHDLRHTDGYITGQFAVRNDLVIGAGADGGTGRIRVDGTGAQQYQVAAGSARTCQVLVRKPSGAFVPAAGTVDLRVQAFALEAGDFTAPSGELRTGGTWSTSQALLVHTGGTFNHNNGAVVLDPYCNVGAVLSFTADVIPSTVLNDLTTAVVSAWTVAQVVVPATDSVHVDGMLRFVDGRVRTGAFEAFSDVEVGPGHDGGDAQLVFAGTTNQLFDLTGATDRWDGDVRLFKDAGAVTLATELRMDAAGQELLFTRGHLFSTATELLILGDNVATSGASDSGFVDGPMRKVGNEAFWFPVGDADTAFAPIRIAATGSTSNAFDVEYFHVDPDTVPFDVTLKEPTLDHISRCEYWQVARSSGTATPAVTLSWAARSCGVTDLSDLLVARWDSTMWRDHGNGGTTGNSMAGTVITAGIVTDFTWFTLASGSYNNPLPVELLDFEAVARPGHVDLRWTTASEVNNDRFVVERTRDGHVYEPVVEVAAAGDPASTTNYAGIDPRPWTGLSYYRLAQVDLDGSITYSDLVAVRYEGAGDPRPLLYPNPSDGASAWLLLPEGPGPTHMELLDAAGRSVYGRDLVHDAGDGPIDVLAGKTLAPGSYTVRLTGNDGEGTVRLVVR